MTKKPKALIDVALELLRDLAKAYTRHHDALKVNGAELGGNLVLSYQGHPQDHPMLVGSKGAHVLAMGVIFTAFGRVAKKRVRLTLLEPAEKATPEHIPFVPVPNWNATPLVKLLQRVLDVTVDKFVIQAAAVGEQTSINVDATVDPDFARSVHLIFHAIGKNQGRFVTIDFSPANEPASV